MKSKKRLKKRLIRLGDTVCHTTKSDITGTVADFTKRNGWVMVNLSDSKGIMFRWVHESHLIVTDENRPVNTTTAGENMSKKINHDDRLRDLQIMVEVSERALSAYIQQKPAIDHTVITNQENVVAYYKEKLRAKEEELGYNKKEQT